ncbi:PTS glucose/sucrose transporter subunit IIB [Actinomyces sp. Marseille-P3109]|nr:PTS glucose/sucrose transporter subunit IIB [Actinomyces sp. Marseille-P3109]
MGSGGRPQARIPPLSTTALRKTSPIDTGQAHDDLYHGLLVWTTSPVPAKGPHLTAHSRLLSDAPFRHHHAPSQSPAPVRSDQEEPMSQAQSIVDALGGFDNIVEIEPCITRLRCELEDGSLVDEPALKAAGAHGVVKLGEIVQVVVGPNADTIAEDIEDLR